MLPNRHSIYLHDTPDTPAEDKFASTSRAFSHDCIMLSRPIDLSHMIIGKIPRWSNERVYAVLTSGLNTKVVLPRKNPVHLIYATAFKDENGVEFRPDVYGRERKLYAALIGRSLS
jgi:murein L,D-transpeptidase YcbB/YkuD